jgi:hypothetical protein
VNARVARLYTTFIGFSPAMVKQLGERQTLRVKGSASLRSPDFNCHKSLVSSSTTTDPALSLQLFFKLKDSSKPAGLAEPFDLDGQQRLY